MPGAHARLELDVDLTAEPIQGVVRPEHGPAEPFAGWMALTRAVETWLAAARSGAPRAGDRDSSRGDSL